MSSFLLTGGGGFIGSNIVKRLLSKGHKVRVIDNFSTGKRENLAPFGDNPNFQLFEVDLRDIHSMEDTGAVLGVDYVLHQGALPSVPRSILDPVTTNNVNILGTLNILELSRKFNVKRVVYASSSSVYGDNKTLPKVEDMPVSPISPYAISKYAGERYCQVYYKIYGLETVCLRYFNVFGLNQDPTSQYSSVIPKFIHLMKKGEPPVIFGDGKQTRDFTYVENNVEANLLACYADDAAGEVFNIACGERYTLLELVDLLNNLLDVNVKPKFDAARPGEVKHSLAGIEKAKKFLKFSPIVNFKDGLKRTIENF
jgi:UDP-glucose 4-epimerase